MRHDPETPVPASVTGRDVADGARPEVLVALCRAVARRVGNADEGDVAAHWVGIVRSSEKRRNAPPIGAAHRALSGGVVHAPILECRRA